MSDNDIKPVAWVERNENGHDRMWSYSLESWANRPANPEPLYNQSAIDRITAERDAAVAALARVKASVGAIYYGVRAGFSDETILEECVEAAPELAAIDAARAEGGV